MGGSRKLLFKVGWLVLFASIGLATVLRVAALVRCYQRLVFSLVHGGVGVSMGTAVILRALATHNICGMPVLANF